MRASWGVLLLASALAVQAQERTLSASPREPSDQRLALVIGNSNYKVGPLRNPVNDARAMAAALKSAGFEVMHGENLSHRQLFEMTRAFGRKLKPGVVALFYYAGHGLQVRDRNFLIPVEADVQSEEEVPYTSVDVNFLLDVMNRARSRVNIVILDACRNNPFARSFRSGSSGLAQMEAPSGTLIAYATAPGRVASDGSGDHGLYTQHLLKHLTTPGLPVEILFKRVREGVERETKSQQVPWESSSLKGDFYFAAAAPVPAPAPPAAPAAPDRAFATELAFWDSIKASQLPSDYQAYLATYPSGRFAALAKARVSALEKEAGQRAASLDGDFWDGIKASANPAEYQAYLEQFPNGRFASLAKARVNSLKAAAAKPAPVVAAPPAASPPVQVALAAPTPVASGKLPAIGERYSYQYTDLWKPGLKVNLIHSVSAIRPNAIIETVSTTINGRTFISDAASAVEPEIREWKIGQITLREFAPFALAMDLFRPGQAPAQVKGAPPEEAHVPEWSVTSAASEEEVTVPAGRFKATKLVLKGTRPQQSVAILWGFEMSVWYAPEVKRYVKLTYDSFGWAGGASTTKHNRDLYELVSYPR